LNALQGWLSAAHPFPLAMVLLLTLLIGFASSDGSPDPCRLALALAGMLASQLAIGWSNDYLDREVDARHQPAKPVPAGLVEARLLPPAIALALVAVAIAGVVLGAWPLLMLVVGTACGLAYNLGLKGTRYSAVPFLVAFTVLPVFIWTSLDVYQGSFLALYGVGLTLPAAAHVANVLPDLESDRAQGRRTMAVILGRRRSVALTLACQFATLLFWALSLPWLEYEAGVLAPALLVYAALSVCAGLLYMERARRGEVWAFRCIAFAAVVFAAGWLAAV
jgi:4-hydroxybenzoate polyprenyltransferase